MKPYKGCKYMSRTALGANCMLHSGRPQPKYNELLGEYDNPKRVGDVPVVTMRAEGSECGPERKLYDT